MSEDACFGRSLLIGGVTCTVIGKATWGSYYYLASQDEDAQAFIRPVGVIRRAFELGAEVDLD